MTTTGKLSLRAALFGRLLVLRVEERDAQGFTSWRDATLDDLAELGVLSISASSMNEGNDRTLAVINTERIAAQIRSR